MAAEEREKSVAEELAEAVAALRRVARRIACPRVLPEESENHLRNATKEVLLAFRSLLDASITAVEEGGKPRPKRKATKIEVAQ